MKNIFTIILVLILFSAESCKDKPVPDQSVIIEKISFARPDSLLTPEKIDTSKLEPVYRQYDNDPGALTINKDQTFFLQFSGWIHQAMAGNWYLNNDTLNCYVTSEYCSDPSLSDLNKNSTFKFILLNNNLYEVGNFRKPYFCKKMYDYYIQCTYQNLYIP